MEMNKEKYEELMRRFSQELYEVGITDDDISRVKDTGDRTPNISGITVNSTTDKFSYRHGGYLIEATREVSLTVKKCS